MKLDSLQFCVSALLGNVLTSSSSPQPLFIFILLPGARYRLYHGEAGVKQSMQPAQPRLLCGLHKATKGFKSQWLNSP